MRRKAFITGITGQDGAYLSRLLLSKNYEIHGLIRPCSTDSTGRISEIAGDINLHEGDIADGTRIFSLVGAVKPDEIYHLAAQSQVYTSFTTPIKTSEDIVLGTLNVLEAVRVLKPDTKIYNASTSELYGRADVSPQDEETPMRPCSPYAAAKLNAYWNVRNYREAYGLFASSGILFNHESPLRGERFVTGKIIRHVHAAAAGEARTLYLGNLDAMRDWGHAADYVDGMWRILQHSQPDDFVLATGVTASVREFARQAFMQAGITLVWQGAGMEEKGICAATGHVLIGVAADHFRPLDVANLCGNADKARRVLGWRAETSLSALIEDMLGAAAISAQGRAA